MLKEFIKDNKLDFTGSGSELNGNCVVLAGFALYKKLDESQFLDEIHANIPLTSELEEELLRVFNYAEKKNYGAKWYTEEYKAKFIY